MNGTYVPGVCNIGPSEIAMRRRAGWIGFAVTILLGAALVFFHTDRYWRLLLVFPASLSATGFLQAHFRFCAGFGMKGVFNFGPEVGKTETVEQQEFRSQDRKRARQILVHSLFIGVVVALVAWYL